MKTYGELKGFVQRHGIEHECLRMSKSYECMVEQGGHMVPMKESTCKGWMFGMHNVAGKCGGSDQWIWFRCMNGSDLTDDSPFFFEQRYSPSKNKAFRGVKERKAAYAYMDRRENDKD